MKPPLSRFPTLFLIAAMLFCSTSYQALAADKPPNVVLILTDDQRYDMMGCAGNRIIQTPHMDALAKEGTRFREAFVTTSICAASRASILTGTYERAHGFTFRTPPISDRFTNNSYPALLRKAGYQTGFVGKFGVRLEKGGTKRMFDYFAPLGRNPYFKKQPDGTLRHLTDITGDKALTFLDGCKSDKPFCLSISFNAPHAEDGDPKQYIWPKSVDGLYKSATFKPPKSMADSFFQTNPPFLRNSESRVRYHWRFDEPAKYQRMVRGYYRMISGVDHVIGRVRSKLKEQGLADNTVIIFTSDNGYFLGERGFADKWYIYEYSVRVPMIIVDPRADKTLQGRETDLMALNVDLAPTILELAGVPVPKLMQGRSLVPILQAAKKPWRTDFFYEHLFNRKNIPKSEGVRNERWTYVRWFEQKPMVEELYDHRTDFEQVNNLAADPEFARKLKELRQRTDELVKKWSIEKEK